MITINNNEAAHHAARKELFRNHKNTMFSRWRAHFTIYVVFSYTFSWPLYVWDGEAEMWFGQEEKYSSTSTRHYKQARPSANITVVTRDQLIQIADMGYAGYIKHKLLKGTK